MVPLSSLSSPVSVGFPAYYERLIAITRSEMGFLSASLPLLMLLFLSKALCAEKSREGWTIILSGICFGMELLSSTAAAGTVQRVRKQWPSRRLLAGFSSVGVRFHFATNRHQALKTGKTILEMLLRCC